MDCGKRISSSAIGGGGQVDFLEQLMYCLLMLRGTILEVLEADKTAASTDCNFSIWWRKKWVILYLQSFLTFCWLLSCWSMLLLCSADQGCSHLQSHQVNWNTLHSLLHWTQWSERFKHKYQKENPQHGTVFRYVSGGYKIFFLPFASAYYLKLRILMFKIFCNDQISALQHYCTLNNISSAWSSAKCVFLVGCC